MSGKKMQLLSTVIFNVHSVEARLRKCYQVETPEFEINVPHSTIHSSEFGASDT